MAAWTPKFTKGLWGLVQTHVAAGGRLADLRGAAQAIGEAPHPATLSHLYSRAVEGQAVADTEFLYRGRVDRDVYLARRPAAGMIAVLPDEFSMTGRWRQVIRVLGTNLVTGEEASQFVNVQFDRLLSRGEAIDLALGAVVAGRARYAMTAEAAEYWTTWRLE